MGHDISAYAISKENNSQETKMVRIDEGEIDYIAHPFRKHSVYVDDFDGLLDLLLEVKEQQKRLRNCEWAIRKSLGDASVGDTKTRRIHTKSGRTIKIELPGDTWHQATLKRIWTSWPDFAYVYLRVETVAPQMREIKKLEAMTGPPDFMQRRDLLLSAREPSATPPTVTLEEH